MDSSLFPETLIPLPEGAQVENTRAREERVPGQLSSNSLAVSHGYILVIQAE